MISGPEDPATPESEKVNVVPLADLTLVLLIILMVLMPLVMRSMIKVSTPNLQGAGGQASEPKEKEEAPLVLALANSGWTLDGLSVTTETLGAALGPLLERSGGQRTVVVIPDDDVKVDTVVSAIDLAKQAGAQNVALAQGAEGEKS